MEAAIEVVARPKAQGRTIVVFFAPTAFLSAFLLFWCEPMIGKILLPMLGGAASVWITCVLFFQLMLLAGYGYACALERYAGVRTQILVHAALMLSVFLFLPIRFETPPGASASAQPALWLLGMLIRFAGVPFCIVATTAPLLQNWLSKTRSVSGRDPYFLYAVSNAGSLLALVAYPLWIEQRWGVRVQSSHWSLAYVILLVFVTVAAAIVWKQGGDSVPGSEEEIAGAIRKDKAGWAARLFWIAAAFVPSGLMLAVTNHMLLNLASLPLLWVMPLAIYLITFIVAFARRFQISLRVLSAIVPVLLLILFPLVAVSTPVRSQTLWYVLASHLAVLFAGALLCHTALASRRPDASQLTGFYFWIALGGALGGAFVAVIAPFAFSTVIEYPLLVAAIAFFRKTRENEQTTRGDWIFPATIGLLAAGAWYLFRWASVDILADFKAALSVHAVLALVALLAYRRRVRFGLALVVLLAGYRLALPGLFDDYETLHIERNFFGIKRVVYDIDSSARKLLHGDTLHGLESMDPVFNGEPLSYYHETGPVGDIMHLIGGRPDQHVGVVGLGTGSMAGWARPDRRITFFDVDPQVHDIAYRFFTYLRRCGSDCDVVTGDGRLSIEKSPDGEFDVLMLDAFNSDSIPAHLISREAVHGYVRKLKPDGLILFHVSNRYMDVESLVSAVALDAGLQGLVRYDNDEGIPGKTGSDYVVAARRLENFGELNRDFNWTEIKKPGGIQTWTDDYSNMITIIRWR